MAINSVTNVIPSPSLIYQRVRGDSTRHPLTTMRVTTTGPVISKPLKSLTNDMVTVVTT